MEGPPVAGTPEQLLLLTLARKLDDMDERLGARIDALAAHVLPGDADPPRLAETRPPPFETAEEEGARIARALQDPEGRATSSEKLYSFGKTRYMCIGALRHQSNRDILQANGFILEPDSSPGNHLLRWQAIP